MTSIVKKIPYKKTALLSTGTAIILFLIFRVAVDANAFMETAKNANTLFLWYALLAISPTFILNPLRWFFVLKAYGYNLRFKTVVRAITASYAFILIPGRIGDFVRTYFTKDRIPAVEAIGSVIVEKIIDVLMLLIASSFGLIILGQVIYGLMALTTAICVIAGVIIVKKIGPKFGLTKIDFIYKVTTTVKIPNNPTYLVITGLVSITNWFISFIAAYFLFLAFQATVPFIAIVAYLPITLFIGLIPISIGGIGVRDSAIIALFASYAISAQALAVGLSYSFLSYFLFMLIGIPFAIHYFYPQVK
jgi:glycosyltransferase 2 family protein